MSMLAINGGEPVRRQLFPRYNSIGDLEGKAVQQVLDSGELSRFLGCWHADFYGGDRVRALEAKWAEYFGAKHAIAVNSATSGLYCAVGAAGIGPGDQVIVSPFTMTASAIAPIIFNGVPVFADIEENYFCLDPDDVRRKITPSTKAIIVVDLFGQPYDVDAINLIAREYNLLVIEDAAQAPGAKSRSKYAGTLGDIGVYSLNYHKHIHCGEGGIVVTDQDELAERIRLIRNHAEAVVEAKGYASLVNMVGFNFRMTEIEAAVATEQLGRLKGLLKKRQENVNYLNQKLKQIPCLDAVETRKDCEHAFYVLPLLFKPEAQKGLARDVYIEAVKAELAPTEGRQEHGVLIGNGYVRPLYLQPMYQQLIAYGSGGCPFRCPLSAATSLPKYNAGICPACEDLYSNRLITSELASGMLEQQDMDDIYAAFDKVWDNRRDLVV